MSSFENYSSKASRDDDDEFYGGRKSRKGAGLFGPSICSGNERVTISYPDGSSFTGPCSKKPNRSDGVLVGLAGPPTQKFGYGGRKSRKGGRKSRKGGRKSRKGGRKSRKGGRKSRKY